MKMEDDEINISGKIYAHEDQYSKDGVMYTIKPSRQAWVLPVGDLEPKDLRALADDLEKRRNKNKLTENS